MLVHFARAVVCLSELWDRKQLRPYPQHSGDSDLSPRTIHSHAIIDLSEALGLSEIVARRLIGTRAECRMLRNSKFFPKVTWVPVSKRVSRPVSLWDAFYGTAKVKDEPSRGASRGATARPSAGPSAVVDDDDEDGDADDEEQDEEYESSPKAKGKRGGKVARGGRKAARKGK